MATSKSSLKAKMDKVWSEWIRRKDSKGGVVACVTCGAVKRWQEQQCGHFVSRVHLSTRFDVLNCHVQCLACNVWRRGNMDEFAIYLEKNFGFGAILELNARKHISVKYSRSDYESMIEDTKAKLAGLDEFAEAA